MVHIDKLDEHIVGHKIISANSESLTLDSGVVLAFEGAEACCAYSYVILNNFATIDHVVTAITYGEAGDGSDSYVLHVMAGLDDVLDIEVEQNNTSGYYMVDVTFRVMK